MSCCVRDFRDKEVISISDGKRLGYVCDIEVDASCGRIRAIIVPGDRFSLPFSKSSDIVIPWECIKNIGKDIILVDMSGLPMCK